jgi:hypothetical protein
MSEQRSGIFDGKHSLDAWCESIIPPSPPLRRLPMVPEGF